MTTDGDKKPWTQSEKPHKKTTLLINKKTIVKFPKIVEQTLFIMSGRSDGYRDVTVYQ